jgi:hypothetical protein
VRAERVNVEKGIPRHLSEETSNKERLHLLVELRAYILMKVPERLKAIGSEMKVGLVVNASEVKEFNKEKELVKTCILLMLQSVLSRSFLLRIFMRALDLVLSSIDSTNALLEVMLPGKAMLPEKAIVEQKKN